MMRWPVPFDGVRCLVSPQPVTPGSSSNTG